MPLLFVVKKLVAIIWLPTWQVAFPHGLEAHVTNPVVSQSLTIGYTFLTVVWVTRCCIEKLISVSWFDM